MKKLQVALDGPVSSGKTTVGSQTARALGYFFVDTGLMYRAAAWKIRQAGAPEKDWGKTAAGMKFEWRGQFSRPVPVVDGRDVSRELQFPEISLFSSRVAANPAVRTALVARQREMAGDGGVVMVGRDIGTVVLAEAQVKVFLTASVEERAKRRHSELQQKGIQISLEQVTKELRERDESDSSRKDSPLRPAPDSVRIDSTFLSQEDVAGKIVDLVKARGGAL